MEQQGQGPQYRHAQPQYGQQYGQPQQPQYGQQYVGQPQQFVNQAQQYGAMQQPQQQTPPGIKPDNNMGLAIFSTVCCCLPFGIVAIVKANNVNTLWFMKQYDAAIMAANDAKKWSLISIVLGLIIFVLYIFLYGGLGLLGIMFG